MQYNTDLARKLQASFNKAMADQKAPAHFPHNGDVEFGICLGIKDTVHTFRAMSLSSGDVDSYIAWVKLSDTMHEQLKASIKFA